MTMRVIIYSFVLTFLTVKADIIPNVNISCDIHNTINISSGELDKDGKFHHDGLIYDKGLFAKFDYIYVNFTTTTKVDPHVRGCVCELKKCIRVCKLCQDGEDTGLCVKTENIEVPLENGGFKNISLVGEELEYGVIVGKPCEHNVIIDSSHEADEWFFNLVRSEYFDTFSIFLKNVLFTG